jgi:hypothetical protein
MLRRLALAFLAIFAVAGYAFLVSPLSDPHPAETISAGTLAIRDAKIYVSPDEPPPEHASILIRDGRIAAVGPNVVIPTGTELLPCDRCVVTAGFWNAHVHFTEPHWQNAAFLTADRLNAQLQAMLTSRGFTTVVDLGSDPRVTISLRRRIETGGLLGPRIYSALAAQYPPHGIPYYLRDTLPPFLHPRPYRLWIAFELIDEVEWVHKPPRRRSILRRAELHRASIALQFLAFLIELRHHSRITSAYRGSVSVAICHPTPVSSTWIRYGPAAPDFSVAVIGTAS